MLFIHEKQGFLLNGNLFVCVNMSGDYREFDYLLKILLVGNAGVGKTSMAFRATNDTFDTEVIATLGIDFKTKFVKVSNKTVKLQIWDTSGQERYQAVTTHFFRGAKGALLVYDITDQKSFRDIASWLESIQDHSDPEIEIIIIGNKCDKENKRIISEAEGRAMAEQNRCLFFETSAQSNTNIQFVFEALAEKIVNAHLEGRIYLTNHDVVPTNNFDVVSSLEDTDSNINRNGKCCR